MFADKTAGRRTWVVLADQLDSICIAAISYKGNIAGDVHMCRTESYAGNRLGNRTAASFVADMSFKIITSGMDHPPYHFRSLRTDGTVSGLHNGKCSLFDQIQDLIVSISV